MRTLVVLSLVTFLSACSDGGGINTGTCLISDTDASNTSYGEFTSIQKQYSLSKEYVAAKMTERSADLGAAVSSGVHVYKVSYNSKKSSSDTDTITASGLLIVPYTACTNADNTAPMIVLNHGTIVDNASAPTNSLSEGLFEGGLGFITIVPDYIGFGDSYVNDPSVRIHPYIIADTYATDGYAIMKAASQVLNANSITPGNYIYKGYSEGGYAALALQQYLESSGQTDFTITATAPSAGPYSTLLMSDALTSTLGRQRAISPTLFGYLATSYWYNYQTTIGAQYSSLDDVFLQTNNYNPSTLFDGTKSSTETEATYAGLGISTMATLMQSDVLDAMNAKVNGLSTAIEGGDITGALGIAGLVGTDETLSTHLSQNDLMISAMSTGYRATAPTLFYHCPDDTTIPLDITAAAQGIFAYSADFLGASGTSYLIDTQTGGHTGCSYALTPSICFLEIEGALAQGVPNAATYLDSVATSASFCNDDP